MLKFRQFFGTYLPTYTIKTVQPVFEGCFRAGTTIAFKLLLKLNVFIYTLVIT